MRTINTDNNIIIPESPQRELLPWEQSAPSAQRVCNTRSPPQTPAAILTTAGGKNDDVTPVKAKRGRPSGKSDGSRKLVITIRCGHVALDKVIVASHFPEYEQCCVTLERGSGSDCENHIHCYFLFKEKHRYVTLIEYLHTIPYFSGCTFHVEGVKDVHKYLRYITKQDRSPYFVNVNTNSFSFYYHACKELSAMDQWDTSHWFVVLHRNCYKFLESLWLKIHKKYNRVTVFLWPIVLFDVQWFLDLYNWYSSFVSCEHYHKKKHMYLWGPSNMGKSTAINLLLRDLGNRVYFAADQHPFGGYYSNIHRCILFDEFRSSKYDMTIINKCLEGSDFYCNEKYQVERIERNKWPIIFVSNFPPPNSDYFLNRVVIIQASCPLQVFETPTAVPCSVIIEEDIDDAL